MNATGRGAQVEDISHPVNKRSTPCTAKLVPHSRGDQILDLTDCCQLVLFFVVAFEHMKKITSVWDCCSIQYSETDPLTLRGVTSGGQGERLVHLSLCYSLNTYREQQQSVVMMLQ